MSSPTLFHQFCTYTNGSFAPSFRSSKPSSRLPRSGHHVGSGGRSPVRLHIGRSTLGEPFPKAGMCQQPTKPLPSRNGLEWPTPVSLTGSRVLVWPKVYPGGLAAQFAMLDQTRLSMAARPYGHSGRCVYLVPPGGLWTSVQALTDTANRAAAMC